jgi:uncharacterized protein (DUF1330 family)
MPAFAVAHIRQVTIGPPIEEYIQRIDATLTPFGGRFVVHGGGAVEVLEGSWIGHLIVLEFPDMDAARAWYRSPAYQAILPLRLNNSDGDAVLVEGVAESHRATDILPALRSYT